jgi:hypothetical protein
MNKVVALLFVTLLMIPLAFIQFGVGQPVDYGYIEPPLIETNVCNDFTVTVLAHVSYQITGFDFVLIFNTVQMHVVNVMIIPPWMGGFNAGSGFVLVQGTDEVLGPGNVPLAAITFHCDVLGSSQLYFDVFTVKQFPSGTTISLPAEGSTVNQYNFYWKPGDLMDYALNGVPDFDQKQDAWTNPRTGQWSYCGPTAIANSFWWLDSFYEPSPVAPPSINDHFPLVWSYNPAWDDHDPRNVGPLISDLSWYMDTDGKRTGSTHNGTRVMDMARGIDKYLLDHGLYDDFYQKTVKAPDFFFVEHEVEKCEDVTLLLGFWQTADGVNWWRVGGHYVTVAGVDSAGLWIGFSDPCIDNAEAGGLGVVLPGPHGVSHPSWVHNDTRFVSHDVYAALIPGNPNLGGSPGNPNFEVNYNQYEIVNWTDLISNTMGQNSPSEFESQTGPYNPGLKVFTEVEYAVIVSPWYAKPPAVDYAPVGVPDFDQRQSGPKYNWKNPYPPVGTWGFSGPVAEANSLWYLDSYYEPEHVLPPVESDNFPLVTAYGPWDDHDPRNVPLLVEDLAMYMDTNGIASQIPHCGTYVWDMQMGIEHYLRDKGLSWKFYEHTEPNPSIKLIDDELRKCQDVVLLLGFWQLDYTGFWRHIGGHYVTVVGMDSTDMFMTISDPIQDKAEAGGMGSVPVPHDHPKTEPPYTTHNNASLVSHDLYRVILDPCPGGDWSLEDYWNESIHGNFIGQNFPETEPYDPTLLVHTQIEYAVIVSCKTGIVVAGSEDTNIYVWDFFGTLQWQLALANPVVSVAMDNDGRFIAAGTRSPMAPITGSLWLFDNSLGGPPGNVVWTKTLNISTSYGGGWGGSESKSVDVKYNSHNGGVVVAAATDQGLYLYDQLGNLIFHYQDPRLKTPMTIVRISQDGNYIICGYTGSTIYYFSHLADGVPGWSSADGNPLWYHAMDSGYHWVAISGIGDYVAASRFYNNTHTAVDLIHGVTGLVWTSYVKASYVRVDMPCNGRSVVAVNDDPSDSQGCDLVYWSDGGNGWNAGDSTPVWTYWPGKEIGSGHTNTDDFYTVAISENGDYVATGGIPRNTYLLDKAGTLPPQQTIGLMPHRIQSVDLTFTGKYGASVDFSGALWFFDKDMGFKWSWANPSANPFHCVAVSKIYPCMFPYPNHDVDITNVTRYRTPDGKTKTIVCQGYPANEINITLSNHGDFIETVEVRLYAYSPSNNTLVLVGNITVTINPGTNPIVSMDWNSTNVPYYGNYTLYATIGPVQDEINVYDNEFIDCNFLIVGLGDIDPNRWVEMKDIRPIAKAFDKYPGDPVYHPNCDLNCDYYIDMKDLRPAAKAFNAVYP